MLQSKNKYEINNSLQIVFFLNREEQNLDKSRYRDVIPGEATRVKLQCEGDEKSDFINANYVSGHDNQEKAYIFTQGIIEKHNEFQKFHTYIFRTTSNNSKRFLAYGLARKYCYHCHDNKYS
jgi:protein tyrosine phosphatase